MTKNYGKIRQKKKRHETKTKNGIKKMFYKEKTKKRKKEGSKLTKKHDKKGGKNLDKQGA